MRSPTRRAVLGTVLTTAVALAGCQETTEEPPDDTEQRDGGADEPATATGAGPTSTATDEQGGDETADDQPDTTTEAELDLREANVVGVEVTDEDGGDYRFDVTLYHDDDGEDGYANWWQVETLDGTQLGRRDLSHAHSTAPFTRSETIAVPEDMECVVVRGHDQTRGYGGQAMAVAVPGGETRPIQQGPERQSVVTSDCP